MLQQTYKSLNLPYKDKSLQQSCDVCPINEIQNFVVTYLKKVEKGKFATKLKYISGNIRSHIDLLLSLTRKNKSILKIVITSLLAKLVYKDWDTRLHKKKIGGFYNLDSIDEKFVSPLLFKEGYYESSTKFSLTASLNMYEPFNEDYKGGISPKECKSSFLFLMKEMNENSKFDCEKVLLYILQKLKKRKDNLEKLQKKTLILKEEIFMETIYNLLNEIFDTVENCSLIPVIAIHTVCINSFNNLNIKDLKEHTACDKNTDSFGDIEGYDKDGNLKLAIEVKHKINIDDNIINIFEKKFKKGSFCQKFILTTSSINYKVIKNTILDNVSNFILNRNSQSPDYLLLFRKAILDYKNLDIKVKEDCEKIFEKYMK